METLLCLLTLPLAGAIPTGMEKLQSFSTYDHGVGHNLDTPGDQTFHGGWTAMLSPQDRERAASTSHPAGQTAGGGGTAAGDGAMSKMEAFLGGGTPMGGETAGASPNSALGSPMDYLASSNGMAPHANGMDAMGSHSQSMGAPGMDAMGSHTQSMGAPGMDAMGSHSQSMGAPGMDAMGAPSMGAFGSPSMDAMGSQTHAMGSQTHATGSHTGMGGAGSPSGYHTGSGMGGSGSQTSGMGSFADQTGSATGGMGSPLQQTGAAGSPTHGMGSPLYQTGPASGGMGSPTDHMGAGPMGPVLDHSAPHAAQQGSPMTHTGTGMSGMGTHTQGMGPVMDQTGPHTASSMGGMGSMGPVLDQTGPAMNGMAPGLDHMGGSPMDGMAMSNTDPMAANGASPLDLSPQGQLYSDNAQGAAAIPATKDRLLTDTVTTTKASNAYKMAAAAGGVVQHTGGAPMDGPMGVGADYSLFSGGGANHHYSHHGGGNNSPDMLPLYSTHTQQRQPATVPPQVPATTPGPVKGPRLMDGGVQFYSGQEQPTKVSGGMAYSEGGQAKFGSTAQPSGTRSTPNLLFEPAPQQQDLKSSGQHNVNHHQAPAPQIQIQPTAPPPGHQAAGPPGPDQLLMSNRFTAGVDKVGNHNKFVPEPGMSASKTAGLGPIPGLNVPIYGQVKSAASETDLRAPCDLRVDTVFAIDSMDNIWLARESIRYYETQLLPSRQARFGVVLCGEVKSFYTALHGHFSGLLASLEDLQHANATLDPAEHMPDTPGYRSENNPYPPRVSEDFQQTDSGCLETAYYLFGYTTGDKTERLLNIIGTKERWASNQVVEEARYLHSLNISILTLADGKLPRYAKECLRNMASTPDKFRSISDNVTLHALPAMIGSAICRPHKADVTVSVQRTALGKIQQPVIKGCRQLNETSLERTQDFGRFFGIHTDQVRCVPGLVPDPHLCACV